MKVDYKNFEIEVIDDKNYNLNSINNLRHYQKFYFEENEICPSNKHAIIIKELETEISSELICETDGAIGIFDNSFIIADYKI